MKVKVSELKEGYRLLEDVTSLTKYPIVPKNTVITDEIIEVLKAFLIEEVNVTLNTGENPPVQTGQKDIKDDRMEAETKREVKKSQRDSFEMMYMKTVNDFKREFISWQAGNLVDISIIRNTFLPLFEQIEKNPVYLLLLQNYVNHPKEYLYHHAVSVGLISGYLAKRMNYGRGEYIQVALAGCLSDCGMAKISPSIFEKKQILSEEMKEIKTHPTHSYKMLLSVPALSTDVKIAVLQHHERLDGSGYPLKTKGDKIHPYAKIIAIADTYHALVCDRIYKEKISPFQAIDMLMYGSFGKFDVRILQAFVNCIMPLSINMHVLLSTNQTGKIVYVDKNNPTKPIVKLSEEDRIISLAQESDISITKIFLH